MEWPILAGMGALRSNLNDMLRFLSANIGRYVTNSQDSFKVILEEGVLFIKGWGAKFPVFPESETKFFLKTEDFQISFRRDETGNVTSAILHQGGQEEQAKKVQ